MTIELPLRESFAALAYRKGTTTMTRHRMSKELAQELRTQYGEGAYLYCVEKLSNGTSNPELWRDVLAWLDDVNTETNEGEK